MKKLLVNGQVWQPEGFAELDIQLEDGVVTALGKHLDATYAETVDCRDKYIIPPMADMHVHVGEKVCGLDLADNWQTLSKLTGQCGVGALGAFVTERSESEKPEKSLLPQYRQAQAKAKVDFTGIVRWHLTPRMSKPQDVIPLLKEGADLKFYTTYRPNGLYRSYKEIAVWMKELKDFKPRILVHCEDDEVVKIMSTFHPFHHPFDHTKRRPEMAEILAVERVLDVAIQYNYPVHIVHVSSPEAALLIRQAKRSLPVTCETAPHYLLLNESNLHREDGHRWLCTPPLRNEKARGLMVELLQDGLFDTIATDHCPYTRADKDKYRHSPEKMPMGIAGLGATLPLLYENLVKTGKITLETLMPLLIDQPSKLLGLEHDKFTVKTGYKSALYAFRDTSGTPEDIMPSLSDTYNPWVGFDTTLKIGRLI